MTKKIWIAAGVLLPVIFYLSVHKRKRPTPEVPEGVTIELAAMRSKQAAFRQLPQHQRQIQQNKNIIEKRFAQSSGAAEFPSKQPPKYAPKPVVAPAVKAIAPAPAKEVSPPKRDSVGIPNRQAPSFEAQDLALLKNLAARAQQQGSKIAYVGEVPDLYAFDPKFFVSSTNASGQVSLHPHQVQSVENNHVVQREPYPIPSTGQTDYEILSRAIYRATDDGAMVINLTSSHIDRTRLEDPINYARSRGTVVVTIRPNR